MMQRRRGSSRAGEAVVDIQRDRNETGSEIIDYPMHSLAFWAQWATRKTVVDDKWYAIKPIEQDSKQSNFT
jgi:hypothetical protein